MISSKNIKCETQISIKKITVKKTRKISRTHKKYFQALKAIFITHFIVCSLIADINYYEHNSLNTLVFYLYLS